MFDKKIKELAIMRALGFLKFHCNDDESFQFANSPIISSALRDLMLEYNKDESVLEINSKNLMSRRLIVNGVKNKISYVPEWNNLNDNEKEMKVVQLSSPYIFSKEIINDIIRG